MFFLYVVNSTCSALAACCGTTPLPSIVSCSCFVSLWAGLVTWPSGSPIAHSMNGGFTCWFPFRPVTVGGGAGRVMVSQWRIAGM